MCRRGSDPKILKKSLSQRRRGRRGRKKGNICSDPLGIKLSVEFEMGSDPCTASPNLSKSGEEVRERGEEAGNFV